MGLYSFGCCLGMRSLFWCNNCMYICSYGSRRFGFVDLLEKCHSVVNSAIFLSTAEYM